MKLNKILALAYLATLSIPLALAETNVNKTYYAVFDCGSSGSRVFLYRNSKDKQELLFSTRDNKPLDKYISNSSAAISDSLLPLLQQMQPTMAANGIKISDLEVDLLSTAGMRYVAEQKQNLFYNNLKAGLNKYGYSVNEARTITGQEEGIFAWIDANHLTGNIGKDTTDGILEIGGASTQIVFDAGANYNGAEQYPLTLRGKKYNLYAISFLGLGKNRAYQQLVENTGESTLCNASNSDFTACQKGFERVINSFVGVSQATRLNNYKSTTFYGFDYIYEAKAVFESDFNLNQYCKANGDRNCITANYVTTLVNDNLKPTTILPVETIANTKISWTSGYLYNRLNAQNN